LIYRFAFDYTDKNRSRLSTYENAKNYLEKFRVDDNILRELIAYADKNGVKYKADEYNRAKHIIETQVKAYIGRNMYGNDAFYPVLNQDDPAVAKALEVLQSNTMMSYLSPATLKKDF
jgi:carboxyl-terminal processing protease